MREQANLVVIGTGGTIAGRGETSSDTAAYACSVLTVDEILSATPELAALANLRSEQLLQVGSENFGNEHLLMIGKRVAELLVRDDVDGVIVTHGTDTIEETAYFLHLTLKSNKPVVVVGSMRPPSSMSSDAPLNLYDAICVAIHPDSRGKGVLVVANEEIHTARDVMKTNSFKLESFRSPYGPLGYVVEGQPRYYRMPARAHTVATPWSIDDIDALPKVDIVYAYGALDAGVIATVASAADGIVYAGTGNGNVAEHIVEPLRQAARDGLYVVRASRTGHGVVIRNGAQPDDDYGWLVVDDQPPPKARVLLMLALSSHRGQRAALQAAFYRY
ncbi:MAG TPA: asparaginase [Paraburkholderia sp.]|jgi:glutamin-(asparagin-)ase|nr:asparaginase [Paraburkholderia sp.]